MDKRDEILILSDFNAEILAGLFNNDTSSPAVSARATGFGQVVSVLHKGDAHYWENKKALLVWTTQPRYPIAPFKNESSTC